VPAVSAISFLPWMSLVSLASMVSMVSMSLLLALLLLAPPPAYSQSEDSCIGALSQASYDALYALYLSADGPNWAWDKNNDTIWYFPCELTVPCTERWQGMFCLPSSTEPGLCEVEAIELRFRNLRGYIPPQLGNLTKLGTLYLNSNSLTGPIPTELGYLTSVSTFMLNSNFLTGTIPTELGNMAATNEFMVNNNNLIGTLPVEILNGVSGCGKRMTALEVYYNFLTGTLPTELGTLASLEFLDLEVNSFSGTIPTELGKLESMSALNIGTNCLDGTLPTELSKLKLLTLLYANYNLLTGEFPVALTGFAIMDELFIYSNLLTGTVLPEFGDMPKLTQLNAANNFFSGSIPTGFWNSTSLQQISFSYNPVTGSLPTEIGLLTTMTQLYVDNTLLAGSLPTELGSLRTLQQLMVYSASLYGSLPTELGLMSSLQEICVFVSSFTGYLPTELGQLRNLQLLEAYDNFFSGSIPAEFQNLISLTQLYLDQNEIVGPIPTFFGQLGNLSVIGLNGNFLTGLVPSELANLRSLIYLNVSLNKLKGNLGQLFATSNFSNVVDLDFSLNAFTGTLPRQLFQNSRHLSSVILFSNCFSGTVPDEICESPVLQTLILDGLSSGPSCASSVDLSIIHGFFPKYFMQGSIPDCIWSMPNITTLHLSSNGFTGTIGPVPSDSLLQDINIRGNLLSGTIPTATLLKSGSYTQLDFSRNRFSGILPPNLELNPNSTTYVDFSVNRLSGLVPAGLSRFVAELNSSTGQQQMPATVIYGTGNLFQCSSTTDLSASTTGHSSSDDDNNVVCGSYNLDVSLGVWGVTTCLALVVTVCYFMCAGSNGSSVSVPAAITATTPNDGQPVLSSNLSDGHSIHNPGVNISTLADNEGQPISSGERLKSATSTVLDFIRLWYNTSTAMRDPSGGVNFVGQLVGRPSAAAALANSVHTQTFLRNLRRVMNLFLVLTACYVVIVQLTYVLLKTQYGSDEGTSQYSTHTMQYGWITTAAFLHAYLPPTLITIYLSLSHMFIACYIFPTFTSDLSGSPGNTTDLDSPGIEDLADQSGPGSKPTNSFKSSEIVTDLDDNGNVFTTQYFIPCALQLMNISVILIVNGLYVYFILENVSATNLFLLQLFLSVFKLTWKSTFVIWAMKMLEDDCGFSLSGITTQQTIMYLVNFIAGPLLATLFTDTTCLYYAVEGQSTVTSNYAVNSISVEGCVEGVYDHGANYAVTKCYYGLESGTQTSTLTPPWIYSYQCSSALLINYVPVLLYVYTLSGVVIPLAQIVVMISVSMWPKQTLTIVPAFLIKRLLLIPPSYLYHSQEGLYSDSSVVGSVENESVTSPLGPPAATIHKISADCEDVYTSFSADKHVSTDGGMIENNRCIKQNHVKADGADLPTAFTFKLPHQVAEPSRGRGRKLVSVHVLVSRLLLDLAVMLTFGLASPVLAFAICISVFSCEMKWKLLIGQYVAALPISTLTILNQIPVMRHSQYQLEKLTIGVLEKAVARGFDNINTSVMIVVISSTLFWAVMVFDMISDVYGNTGGAVFAVIVATVLPILFWGNLHQFPVFSRVFSCFSSIVNARGPDKPLQTSVKAPQAESDDISGERGIQLSVDSSSFRGSALRSSCTYSVDRSSGISASSVGAGRSSNFNSKF
jgi:Leucine-rich repeat (LRR) protein